MKKRLVGSTQHPTSDLSWLRYLTLNALLQHRKERQKGVCIQVKHGEGGIQAHGK